MEHADLLAQIEKASLFDIYRMQAAISMMLDDPQRLSHVRDQLAPGQETTYFHWQENRSVNIRILELKRTRVFVLDLEDQSRYSIPMYWINIENSDPPQRFARAVADGCNSLCLLVWAM